MGRICHLRPGIAMEKSYALFQRFFPSTPVIETGRDAEPFFLGLSLITLVIVIFSGIVLIIAGILFWYY